MRSIRGAAILVLGSVLAAPGGALCQSEVRRVTLDEALAAFAQNSLALRIARSEADETTGIARQYQSYANPAFSLVREDLGHAGEAYWETTAGVSQRVEWPGRTTARGRVAALTIEAAGARFRADSLRLAFAVREAYVRAWLAEETEQTEVRVAAVIRVVAEAAQARLAEGDISAYEARRLRLERVRARQEVAEAGLEARAARRTLAALVAPEDAVREVGPSEGMAGLPPVVTTEVALEALSQRPDLEAAARDLDVARALSEVAATGWVPDPTLGFGYKDQADGFSGAALSVSLPLPVFNQGAGTRRGAAARASAATSRLDLRRKHAEIDLVSASDRYNSARARLLAAGDDLLADGDALLAAARAAYAEGEMTLVELLDAASAFRDARVTALSLRNATWVAYYNLLRAMGRTPGESR